MSLKKASSQWKNDKGQNGYIIGSFKMIHTKLDYSDKSLKNIEDINMSARCTLFISLQNNETGKVYTFDLKPATGSDSLYHKDPEDLSENEKDPYWVLEAPPGKYALTTVTFHLFTEPYGYLPFERDMVVVPLSRDLKREVVFNVQPKQIVYVGDYSAIFKTNIVFGSFSGNSSMIYHYNIFKVNLTDEFEKTKEAVVKSAKNSDALQAFQFVSGLTNQ